MEEQKKQTIFGRIAKWALWGSLVSIIVSIAAFMHGELSNSDVFISLAFWLFILALLGFLSGIVLTVVHRIILDHSLQSADGISREGSGQGGHLDHILPRKQTIFGTLAQWAMLIGLGSYILFFIGINAAGPGSFWCVTLPVLFALYFLSLPAVIILSIIHSLRARRLPGYFTVYTCIFLLFLLMLAALPNLVVSIKTERQLEAVNNLKQIYELQEQYKVKNGQYAPTFNELGWKPAGEIKYKYFLSPQESMSGSAPSCDYALPAGAMPNVTADSFNIVALGNIDCDAYMDVWRIDSQKQLINDMCDKYNSAELNNCFDNPPRRYND